MKRISFVHGIAAVLYVTAGVSSYAAEVPWFGFVDNSWDNTANWLGGALPSTGTGTTGDSVLIENGANNYALYTSSEGTRYYKALVVGRNDDARLDVTGGLLIPDDGSSDFVVGSAGSQGELNISGGELRPGSNTSLVGTGDGSVGVVNISGGTLTLGRESSGISGYIGDSGGTGTVSISGGTFRTRAGLVLGNSGTGIFDVQGSGASKIGIGYYNSVAGLWTQNPGSTLKSGIDSGGITPVEVVEYNSDGGSVTFNNGALLEPYFVGDYVETNAWTVMTWDGSVTDNGLQLSTNITDYRWDFYITNNSLVVTYGIGVIDPNQPQDLSSVAEDDQVTLRWTAVSGATGYNIKRALVSGGSYTMVGTSSTNEFADAGLTSRTEYFYVVSAETGAGESIDSDEASAITSGFVHPGGLFVRSDLERMRYQIENRVDPWYSSYQELADYYRSDYNYTVQGNASFTTVDRDGTNGNQFRSDADAAYCNALMWAITQDSRHADKCVEIFNAWKNLTNVAGTGTYSLNAGIFAWKMVEAAEIIKSTYSGWSASDIQDFKDMLVYPGYSDSAIPSSVTETNGTFYWRIYLGDSGRHANQDAIAWRAMITMGVFLDNEKMYQRALRYFRGEAGRSDDIPLPAGPSNPGALLATNDYFNTYSPDGPYSTESDYGYNGVLTNMFWENGQCQESSRDQAHTFFNIAIASGLAEVAWHQNDTVWNDFENRLLKGIEYSAKYNTSYLQSYPDQAAPWEPTGTNFSQRYDRTGRWFSKQINPYQENSFTEASLTRGVFPGKRPIFEHPLAHFSVRMGLSTNDYLWTQRSRDVAYAQTGYESISDYEDSSGDAWILDNPGWGALCFRRPALTAGDPISGFSSGGTPQFAIHQLAGTIEAENYDWFAADGEGHTYHDLTETNSGGAYRSGAVDIASNADGDIYLSSLESGEWVSYTVNIPSDGRYGVRVRYASAVGGGAISVSFGEDIASSSALPSTGSLTNWSMYPVAENIALDAGVQSFRIYVEGTSKSYVLDSVVVVPMLDYSINGSSMDFSWPANQSGWSLSFKTNLLDTNWVVYSGSTSTNAWSIPLSEEHQYFQLRPE